MVSPKGDLCPDSALRRARDESCSSVYLPMVMLLFTLILSKQGMNIEIRTHTLQSHHGEGGVRCDDLVLCWEEQEAGVLWLEVF